MADRLSDDEIDFLKTNRPDLAGVVMRHIEAEREQVKRLTEANGGLCLTLSHADEYTQGQDNRIQVLIQENERLRLQVEQSFEVSQHLNRFLQFLNPDAALLTNFLSLCASMRFIPTRIAPSVEGGIALSWLSGSLMATLEFYTDAEIVAGTTDMSSPDMPVTWLVSPQELVATLDQLQAFCLVANEKHGVPGDRGQNGAEVQAHESVLSLAYEETIPEKGDTA